MEEGASSGSSIRGLGRRQCPGCREEAEVLDVADQVIVKVRVDLREEKNKRLSS